MLNNTNIFDNFIQVNRPVLHYQPHATDPDPQDLNATDQLISSQANAWFDQQDPAALVHPLQAEINRLQQTLETLALHPPPGLLEKVLWRGLQWSLQLRQKRAVKAWQRAKINRKESVVGPRYDFEPDMILIPHGPFLMGSVPRTDINATSDEHPQSLYNLPDYFLARTPVTNLQYQVFIQATQHKPPRHWENGQAPKEKEDHPVVNVSWYDALAYCQWLSQTAGKPYRLPTEAEWEKAARGLRGNTYPWGNNWDHQRCNSKEQELGDTTPAGLYPNGASPYGLLDMAGNVWEWTSSLYWAYPYRGHDGRENPNSPESRVLRGGSWLNLYDSARAAARRSYAPAYHSRIHGFRCCLSLNRPH